MRIRHLVLGMLSLLAVITYLDRVCISVMGKAMQEDLRLSPQQWGWVLGAFALAYGLFEIPTGMMGDRIGPRRVLTRIVVWWSAFTGLTGLVFNYGQLLVTRFLFGIGEAGAFPNSSATIARWFPATERGRAQGVVWMASRVGGGLSPILVIPIQAAWGWRAVFLVFAGLGVLWAVTWYRWFRNTPREMPGISAEEITEIEGVHADKAHGLGILREALRRPAMWWLMLMGFTYCWGAFFFLSWLHVYLVNGRNFSAADLIRWSWLPFVLGAIANLAGGAASDWLVIRIGLKWGRRLVGIAGLGMGAVLIGAVLFVEDKALTVILLGLGFALTDFMLPVAWAVCLDIGGAHAGTVSGAMNTAGQAGSFLTAVSFGYIVSYTGSYDAPLIVMAVALTLGALCWTRIDPTVPLFSEVPSQGQDQSARMLA